MKVVDKRIKEKVLFSAIRPYSFFLIDDEYLGLKIDKDNFYDFESEGLMPKSMLENGFVYPISEDNIEIVIKG